MQIIDVKKVKLVANILHLYEISNKINTYFCVLKHCFIAQML